VVRCLPVKSCLAEEGNGNFCGDPVSTGLRVPTASPSLLIAENAHQVTFDTLARSKDVFNAGATSHVWGRLLKSDGTAVLEHDAATGQNIIPSVDDVSQVLCLWILVHTVTVHCILWRGKLRYRRMRRVFVCATRMCAMLNLIAHMSRRYLHQNPGFFSIFVNPADDKIYGLQHFEGDAHTVTTASGVAQEAESAKGRLGAVYLAELTAKAGQLEMVRAEPVNFNTAANKNAGVWNPSGGSVTPWSSHLGSEESEPDARKWAGLKGRYVATLKAAGQDGFFTGGGNGKTCTRRTEVCNQEEILHDRRQKHLHTHTLSRIPALIPSITQLISLLHEIVCMDRFLNRHLLGSVSIFVYLLFNNPVAFRLHQTSY